MPVIPALRRLRQEDQDFRTKGSRCGQVVEHLLSKHKALSSNPSTAKRKIIIIKEGVNSTLIYCENFCNCHNVPWCNNSLKNVFKNSQRPAWATQ
jgi:hypothetical protein